jgi:hypothetical protein
LPSRLIPIRSICPCTENTKRNCVNRERFLFDKNSRKIFGKIEIGQDIEINNTLFRVGGFVALGPNFSLDGSVIMSDASWLSTRRHRNMARISYGLIRVAPGVDVVSLRQNMLNRLPKDIILLTPEEMRETRSATHNQGRAGGSDFRDRIGDRFYYRGNHLLPDFIQ